MEQRRSKNHLQYTSLAMLWSFLLYSLASGSDGNIIDSLLRQIRDTRADTTVAAFPAPFMFTLSTRLQASQLPSTSISLLGLGHFRGHLTNAAVGKVPCPGTSAGLRHVTWYNGSADIAAHTVVSTVGSSCATIKRHAGDKCVSARHEWLQSSSFASSSLTVCLVNLRLQQPGSTSCADAFY